MSNLVKKIINRDNIYYEICLLVLVNLLILVFLISYLKPNWSIGSDGYFYYSYSRSILFDGDFDFYNEVYQHNLLVGSHQIIVMKTPIGKVANLFSVGPSILWMPFVFLGHIYNNFFTPPDNYLIAGYNSPYQVAVSISSIFYFFIGLILLYLSIKKLFSKNIAFISTSLIWLTSPLAYYVIYEPSMSHALSFFSLTSLFYFYLKFKKTEQIKCVLILGVILGISMLIRWQNLLFIILPAYLVITNSKNIKQFTKKSFLLISSVLIFFSPQLFMWRYLYGSFIAIPQGSHFFELTNPHFIKFLFSPTHGLFIWNPIFIVSLIGLVLFVKKNKKYSILIVALLLQVYMNSALSDWMGGGSFGARRMVGSIFIFTIGLAYVLSFLYNKLKKNRFSVLIFLAIIIFPILLNLLLMMSCAKGNISIIDHLSFRDIFDGQVKTLKVIKSKLKI